MELQWIVFVLSICVFCCHGDYTCLCNYNVEIPVYTSPDTASAVVGYMYEFDCKNLVSESDPEWPAIEFEHQLGYVNTNGQVKVQTCPGSVPDSDKIASTTPSSTTVFTSTVISSQTTTMSSKTSFKPTSLPPTTSLPSTSTLPSTSASPSSTSLPPNTTLSSNSTLTRTTTFHTTFLPFNKTLSSTTYLSPNSTLYSTRSVTYKTSNYTSMSSATPSVNASSHDKTTLSNKVTGEPGHSTSLSQIVSSGNNQLTSTLSSNSTNNINTTSNKITTPQTSVSTLFLILTTNSSQFNSKFPAETSSTLSSVPTNHSHSLSLSTSPTSYSSINSISSKSSTPFKSTPHSTYQSSPNTTSLPTTLSTQINTSVINVKSSAMGWSATNTQQMFSNLNISSRTTTISTSTFPDLLTTKQTSSTSSKYTSVTKTPSISTTPLPHVVSSISTENTGSTDKPVVSDRVDLCPYKNLAMSVYNSTTYTYPLFRQYGNYCYELRLRLGDWFEAQQDCVTRGGELAVIQNEEVQARVFNLSSSTRYKVDAWIGLHDLNQEGHWEWVNGASMTNSSYNRGILINPAYTDSEDCVVMDAKSGVWKNTACKSMLFDIQSYPWVCQYKMT